jgi:SAM-dependent methyltransferase
MSDIDDSQLYRFNFGLAFKAISRFRLRPGFKRLASFSYWRSLEEPLVINALEVKPDDTILDIGSPKTPFLFLASKRQYTVYGTDIQDRSGELLKNLKLLGLMKDYDSGRIKIEVQDARKLSYDSKTFDSIYSISCLEHIENNGDTKAVKEMARTLKKGGRAVITVPFNHEYKESFRDYTFYDRKYEGEKVFYQRHYNSDALKKRLIKPSKLKLVFIELYGEPGYRFQQKILMRMPKALRAGMSIASPMFQRKYIKKIDDDQIERGMMAAICLIKE